MKIYNKITDLIGNTPLLELKNYEKNNNLEATVIGKLEYFNPAGSVKDRIARAMIDEAESKGVLKEGAVIIEPTSGNTGIGLAMICAVLGNKLILTMPETMSLERRAILKAYGAELVLTSGAGGMQAAVDKANELHEKYPDSFIPSQFENPSNPKAHYLTTAEEIWNDTDGRVDIVAAGVGTGGTICGIAKKLKEKNPKIKCVAIEPYSSRILEGNNAGAHKIQGIGANFVPKNFDKSLIDEIIPVTNEDAIQTARNLSTQEGILAGYSGGANVWAAIGLSKREENRNKLIVTILPDCGDHYLSSELYKL